jgi:hypothetical protein
MISVEDLRLLVDFYRGMHEKNPSNKAIIELMHFVENKLYKRFQCQSK